jgi:hypothetical protein
MDELKLPEKITAAVRMPDASAYSTGEIDPTFESLDARVQQYILSITPLTPSDEAGALYDKILAIMQAVKEWKQMIDEQLCEYIDATGEFEFGPNVYRKGTNRKVECVDVRWAIGWILSKPPSSRIVNELADVLVAQPIKQGAFKTICGEEAHAECFKTTVTSKLDVKGKPIKTLQVVNKDFVKKG